MPCVKSARGLNMLIFLDSWGGDGNDGLKWFGCVLQALCLFAGLVS